MHKKVFGIVFPLFFLLVATRSIEQVKWLAFSAPAFYVYFLLIGIKVLKNKELRICLAIIVSFGLWAMITSFWSPFPLQTIIRSIVFLVSSCSIIIAGFCWVDNYSNNDFSYLIPLNIILLIAAFFSLMTKLPPDYWAGYGYGLKSFWAHQNVFASLIIFTLPGIIILPFNSKKIQIVVTLILSGLNIYLLVLSHSRTSLFILLLSGFLFILLSKRFKEFLLIMLIITGLTTCYFINKDFHNILHDFLFKTELSFLDRKMPIISASYEAAVHGGWKGLGYGVSDSTVENNLQLNIHYHFEGTRLVREKGVSIFALVEETGWVGLSLFLAFVSYLLFLAISSYMLTMDWRTAMMICIIFGMCLHAQLEGWWLGVGSVQFPFFMGVAGIMIGKIRINQHKTA
jgi:hypothetical protein